METTENDLPDGSQEDMVLEPRTPTAEEMLERCMP